MNEELQKALAELFNSVLSAKDFMIGELPEYITQLLMWKAVESFVVMLIGVSFIAASVALIFYSNRIRTARINSAKNDKKNGKDWCFFSQEKYCTSLTYDFVMATGGPSAVCSAFVSVVLFVTGISSINLVWLQIAIAPKVWLVEYAAQLIK